MSYLSLQPTGGREDDDRATAYSLEEEHTWCTWQRRGQRVCNLRAPPRCQCQIECPMRGFEGILGDTCAINISKLLISLASPMRSSPSLTTSKISGLQIGASSL
jgi:hypothetical protein